jgi:hypothetical protein
MRYLNEDSLITLLKSERDYGRDKLIAKASEPDNSYWEGYTTALNKILGLIKDPAMIRSIEQPQQTSHD